MSAQLTNIFWKLIQYILIILGLYSRNSGAFRENKIMAASIFTLFGLIIGFLAYYPETGYIWASLMTIPFFAYYIFDVLTPDPTILFLEDLLGVYEDLINEPETEESEKKNKRILRKELNYLVKILKAKAHIKLTD